MAWPVNPRPARSLLTLREQVDLASPKRDKSSDGMLAGDAHHAANPNSDHEAWVKDGGGFHVVTAVDITHDPHHGVDTYRMAEMLRRSQDKRIKYIISNSRIASSVVDPWNWRPYHGSNPHDHHMHVSVLPKQDLYDDQSLWSFGSLTPDPDSPVVETNPTIKRGASGDYVRTVQEVLGLTVDGKFGKDTETAVREFQKAHGLDADGVVGKLTWDALEKEAQS